ncbi:MAG: AbfB domain-containing protein [Bradyrhizobium sp.]|uniref:AbfB domain-containing protein n=1 Tax=Bradyrhizobium sp. TaxID=376 RepID=UPI002725E417|nr:AbfB domain-containing protein [Bradyrhizobium sp.]MDO9562289.1 AbfB domain-containing protein [Bradyrhizobium sp.]MDP1532172.1 AbfB domain-containing protein [Rubrivivax sp.]MDP3693288.1 AbfB domain-containing protein [Bradyrhizobium sp.]
MSFSLFSNNFQDRFIVARGGFADIAKIETDIDRGNATFDWTGPSLRFDTTGQLRRAVAPLGFVLHIADFDSFRIHEKFFDGIVDPDRKEEVRQESTFVAVPGLIDPNHFSFRSVKFPDRFIRHRSFQLFAEPINTPLDHQDATFRRGPPQPPNS